MKNFNTGLELAKRIFYIIMIMTVLYILIDLYVPLKMLFFGDKIFFSEIITHIDLLHHFPYILIAGIVIGLLWYNRDRQNTDK